MDFLVLFFGANGFVSGGIQVVLLLDPGLFWCPLADLGRDYVSGPNTYCWVIIVAQDISFAGLFETAFLYDVSDVFLGVEILGLAIFLEGPLHVDIVDPRDLFIDGT